MEARRADAALAAACGMAAGCAAFLCADPDAYPGGDQANTGAMVLAAREPGLFADDPLFGRPERWRFYLPAFRWLLGAAYDLTGSLGDAHRLLAAVCAAVFVAGASLLLARVAGSRLAGACAAVAATTVRPWIAGEYFGCGTMASAQPRSVALALGMWLLCAALAGGVRGRWLACGGAGLLANLHPPTAAFLALGLVADAVWRGTPRWRSGLAAAAACVPGALPAFVGLAASAGPPATVPARALADIWYERFRANLLPPQGYEIRLAVAGVLPLVVIAWLAWRHRRRLGGLPEDARALVRIGTVACVGAIATTALAQAAGAWMGGPPLSIDLLRGSRWVYLALYAPCAVALGDLVRSEATGGRRALRLVAALGCTAVLLVPPGTLEWWRSRAVRDAAARAEVHEADVRGASAWLAAHAPGILVASDEAHLRILGRVSVAYSWKDAGFLAHADRDALVVWAGNQHAWRAASDDVEPDDASDRACLVALARMAEARYALVPARCATGDAVWRGTRLALIPVR